MADTEVVVKDLMLEYKHGNEYKNYKMIVIGIKSFDWHEDNQG